MVTRRISLSNILPKAESRTLSKWPVWALPVIGVIIFLPTFFNGFQLGWDDTWQVLRNPLVHDLSWENIAFHFTHFWERQYSPVNSLFYLLINLVFGIDATAFHTACLLIHLVNSWFVFSISVRFISKFLPTIEISKIQIIQWDLVKSI